MQAAVEALSEQQTVGALLAQGASTVPIQLQSIVPEVLAMRHELRQLGPTVTQEAM
jgi:hypothetical protein